ncbi:MAG: bifunctional phosphoribosylaminoimidazolecarboxamide formyltransferase/IMP cyclohydrolase [Candidatus Tectomicrobia bacterium]|uniref:Bifunctional purine biosynthesis protein PurH n=1 Tax=Tectimicrobiota bacterium TaxID=2528274 RepID=A0A932CQF0_UNCTE|nr:bifunctional phosphoribosylaminoimidazolecarboxamide formyltransferase/IMP cyclohydrolase [Candidatus Tectomicrobia bacterium]
MGKIQRALISVSNRDGLGELARGLHGWGIELISTEGTARVLRAEGLPVVPISELTGFPEMLGGRVKTLHPRIYAGILALRSLPEHRDELEAQAIRTIDLVVVNLYPFRQAIDREGSSLEEALENIDIGGVTLIRAAAKNFPDVTVVVDPQDYPRLLGEMEQFRGEVSYATRRSLAGKAFSHTARYDRWITDYLASADLPEEEDRPFPEAWEPRWEKVNDLRYGENPHQRAAFYRETVLPAGSLIRAQQLQGKELSFNNLLDLEAAFQVVLEFREPTVAIIKHNNPCGVGRGKALPEAFARALETDPLSAFGGIIGCNRELDEATAQAMAPLFLEAILAPSFSAQALAALQGKANLRLLALPGLGMEERPPARWELRQIVGGILVQEADRLAAEDEKDWQVVTQHPPTAEEREALRFAWKVVSQIKSNAIVFARADRTVGIGAGQMSRIDSVKLAASKARDSLSGTVLASDGFFPFPDGVEEAARAGATAIVQPGGSRRDPEVIAAADVQGLAMVFTGRRHFRH